MCAFEIPSSNICRRYTGVSIWIKKVRIFFFKPTENYASDDAFYIVALNCKILWIFTLSFKKYFLPYFLRTFHNANWFLEFWLILHRIRLIEIIYGLIAVDTYLSTCCIKLFFLSLKIQIFTHVRSLIIQFESWGLFKNWYNDVTSCIQILYSTS